MWCYLKCCRRNTHSRGIQVCVLTKPFDELSQKKKKERNHIESANIELVLLLL